MSNVYGLTLIAKCPEDSVKIESRAKELLKELTPEEHHEFGYNSFGPNEDGEAGIVFQTTLPVLEKVIKKLKRLVLWRNWVSSSGRNCW